MFSTYFNDQNKPREGVCEHSVGTQLYEKREFQTELIKEAQKRCDVRTYPLGGVENLINSLAKYLKVPKNMIWLQNIRKFITMNSSEPIL